MTSNTIKNLTGRKLVKQADRQTGLLQTVKDINSILAGQKTLFNKIQQDRQNRILEAITNKARLFSKRIAGIQQGRENRQNIIAGLNKKYHITNNLSDTEYIELLLQDSDTMKVLKRIAGKQLILTGRDNNSFYNVDDMVQYLYVRYYSNKTIINLEYFYSCCKWIIKDSLKTLIQQDRKFKAVQLIDNGENENSEIDSDFNLQYTFNYDIITKIDMDSLFDDDREKQVYKLYYVYQYTIRQINDIMGYRVDRIYSRVKAKLVKYITE